MKAKSHKAFILFCVIGSLLMGIMVYMAVRVEGNLPAYSVLNKSPQGFSVYLETLQALGMDARQVVGPPDQQPENTLQIIAYPWFFDTSEPELLKWVRQGGILILASPEPPAPFAGSKAISNEDGIRIEQVGKGKVLTLTASSLTNRSMVKDTAPSWRLTQELIAIGNRPILFNEQVLFPNSVAPSLWKAAPLWMKLAVYQLLMVIGAWFWMKGNRLGTPLPLTAETERTELEYLKAAAHFYRSAGCWDLMLEAYYRSLLRLLGSKEEDLSIFWKREGLPELQKAQALQQWMENPPLRAAAKETQQQIMVIEHLKTILNNRRRYPWSSMKQQ